MLAALISSGKSLAELKSAMHKMPQKMVNVPVKAGTKLEDNDVVSKAVAAVEQRLAGRGRVLLRPSGTEPVVRVMVEGEDLDLVAKEADELAGVVLREVS